MTDYTPTTEQVRNGYVRGMRDTFIASAGEHREEFERWVQAHEDEVRASVRPPTREQIAVSRQLLWDAQLALRPGTPQRTREARRGQLLALFPQPTPSAEASVQVPMSLIERAHAMIDTRRLDASEVLDALAALLSQPTPSAEPMVPLRAVVAVMDHYDNGEGECEPEDRWRLFRDMRSLLASDQVVRPPAGPVSIADMAPGTTFTGATRGTDMPDRWTVLDNGTAQCEHHGAVYGADDFDQSTVRDVTPPDATPEEGDRG